MRPVDIYDGTRGMVAHVQGTVVYRQGGGTIRQPHPKTDASARQIPVPEFAAAVIRRRLSGLTPEQREWTVFHNRQGGPLSLHNFRRTFRDLLKEAGLGDSGITPRWYRRTGATVLARGLGVDAAATHLGHTSTAITEGHYIEPDRSIDFAPAELLERTLRAVNPEGSLLSRPLDEVEETSLELVDPAEGANDEVA
ncbi:MAG: tyrosine-type recombinase/integrase [Nocardioides sp.]